MLREQSLQEKSRTKSLGIVRRQGMEMLTYHVQRTSRYMFTEASGLRATTEGHGEFYTQPFKECSFILNTVWLTEGP